METKLRAFMVFMLQAIRLIMDHIELESVQAENEWVELERSIVKLINKINDRYVSVGEKVVKEKKPGPRER